MDFNNHIVTTIPIGNFDLWITESMINAWIIMGVIIILAIIARIKILKPKEVPTGAQNLVEAIVEMFDKFTISTMGPNFLSFSAFFFGMFIYILFCNLSGLFLGATFYDGFKIEFMRPPTADVSVTFSLALITFVLTQGIGIKSKGVGNWLKGLTEPMWPLTPLNIIGELANPVSLSFRLFGNILGGTIIMGLYYNLPLFALIGIPAALHAYFDVFAGVLQSFIFVMLSMTFISGAE